MFLENKYTRWYFQLIENAKERNQNIEYCEKHHIVPRCLGGSNSSENLVTFSAREHFIAHLLLTKMLTGPAKRKMVFALFRMTSGNNKQQRYNLNNRSYELIKQKMRDEIKLQNSGKWLTPEQQKNYYTAMASKVPWNKGKTMPDDFGQKISATRKALQIKNAKCYKKTRKKISQAIKLLHESGHYKNISYKTQHRYRYILKNKKTSEIEETFHLRDWCKQKGFNSSWLYQGRSNWEIIEKYNFKTGKKLI